MIRSYRDGDAVYLAPIHSAVFPDNPLSISAYSQYVATARDFGGMAWVIGEDSLLGYALAVPVPGLSHIADLKGCIAPPFQRQGYGSRLLNHLLAELHGTTFRQVSHQVRAMNSPAAQFFRKYGFFVEHEEWLMRRGDLLRMPRPEHPDRPEIATLPRREAVNYFHQLFSESFAGHTWDQPYSQDEIKSALGNAADILFLTLDSTPIGFAWLHLEAGGLGVIEPVGVISAHQGRGYGRFLLLLALQELARRGATRAQIGAWRTNVPAVHLYHSLGFKHHETITYLAYHLTS